MLDGGKQEDTKDNKIQPKAALLREGFPWICFKIWQYISSLRQLYFIPIVETAITCIVYKAENSC